MTSSFSLPITQRRCWRRFSLERCSNHERCSNYRRGTLSKVGGEFSLLTLVKNAQFSLPLAFITFLPATCRGKIPHQNGRTALALGVQFPSHVSCSDRSSWLIPFSRQHLLRTGSLSLSSVSRVEVSTATQAACRLSRSRLSLGAEPLPVVVELQSSTIPRRALSYVVSTYCSTAHHAGRS